MDGSFYLKGYTNNLSVKVGYYSDEVLDKIYTINKLTVVYDEKGKIDLDETKQRFTAGNNFPDGVEITSVGENCLTITDSKGFEITLDVMEENKITTLSGSTDSEEMTLVSFPSGALDGVTVDGSNGAVVGSYSIDNVDVTFDAAGNVTGIAGFQGTGFPSGSTSAVAGNAIVITDPASGDTWQFTPKAPTPPAAGTVNYSNINATIEASGSVVSYTNLELDITGIGAMDTQIGANEGQILEIRVPEISLQRLGITGAEVTTEEKSADANVAIKGAIAYVSDARSRLGAYQNRLEHTVGSLDITNENMTASYSRIMDVDLSEEMTYYTTQQVVEQAAISMLAQANERPSQVLQLLQ